MFFYDQKFDINYNYNNCYKDLVYRKVVKKVKKRNETIKV
jgi:hypothetical protein